MTSPQPSLLETQVNRVNRRLFVQSLLNRLVLCWSVALAASLLWFLIQPFAIGGAASWLRWSVAGGLVLVATIVAIVLTALRAPSKLASALSLDERFGLKERVTTLLSLTPKEQETPAGQALRKDVDQHISGLKVGERFPIRLSWLASMVPVGAAVLALVALFYEPPVTSASLKKGDDLKKPPVNAAEISQKMDQLKRKIFDPEKPERQVSEKLKEFESEMEKIANKPTRTKEEVRERMKEMASLEDRMREHGKQLMDKDTSLKNQLKEMNKQSDKNKDGPAADMQKAMAEGDMEKAKEELDKLAKKLQDGKLSDEDKQKLQKQMDQMQQKAAEMAQKMGEQQKKEEERLEQLIREAKAEGRDAEALKKELEQLKKDGKAMKQLQDLAKQMADCKECMQKGDMAKAVDQLQKLGDQMKQLNLTEKEMQDLQDQMQRLQDAKGACAKGGKDGDKDGDSKGDGAGDGNGKLQGENGQGDKQGNGMGSGKNPGGKRPWGKDTDNKGFDAKQRNDPDFTKGKVLDGFEKGPNFKAKAGPEIQGDIKQAAQEAPEAIEQQRIPKVSRDIAKGFFQKLSGQEEKKKP